MSETPNLEFRESKSLKIPNTLDIIKIDGRWGQVVSIGRGRAAVVFLEDGATEIKKLFEYNIKTYWDTALGNLLDFGQVQMTEQEKNNLHYATNENNYQSARMIKVFGEFEKKDLFKD